MHRYLIALFVALALLVPGPAEAHRRRRPPAPVMAATPERLAALADCESGSNPRARSRSGRYTGLYQFDARTWRGVGGTGVAGDASVEEQTHRAILLHAARGWRGWPACSRKLNFR